MIPLFLRQVPGLRAISKGKKKSAPNAPTRTRPPPIDRIAAQRARRSEAARQHNPEGNQADPGPISIGNQGRSIQPDDNLEREDQGSLPPPPDVADDFYYDTGRAEESSHEERDEEEEEEEEEEGNRRYQVEEQKWATRRIEKNWNPSQLEPIPGAMANIVVSPQTSLGLDNNCHQNHPAPTRKRQQMSTVMNSSAVVVQGALEAENIVRQPPAKRLRTAPTNPLAGVQKSMGKMKSSTTRSRKK